MSRLTLRKFIQSLDRLPDSTRQMHLQNLMPKLTIQSKSILLNFQSKWNPNKPSSIFRTEHDKIIKECLTMEMSKSGTKTRCIMGYPELKEDTEI